MTPRTRATRLPCPWNSPGKNTGLNPGLHTAGRLFTSWATREARFPCRSSYPKVWSHAHRLELQNQRLRHSHLKLEEPINQTISQLIWVIQNRSLLPLSNYRRREGDSGSIPRSGRSPGGGHGNPLQYLAWRIPWTEEPDGLQSIGLHRVGHNWSDFAHTQILIKGKTN